MNWADWIIIAIILVSALISLKRGFVKEALSLITWIAAFIIARLFTENLSSLLAPYIETLSIRIVVAFLLLFVATLFAGAVINNLIGYLVKATGLSGTDRALGMVFGIARGGVFVVVLILLVGLTPAIQDQWYRESSLIPHFAVMESWTRQFAADASEFILTVSE